MEIEARSSHNTPRNSTQNLSLSNESLSDATNACDTPSVSERSLALMPVVALPAKAERVIFSTRPEVLLEQAQRIEVWPLPECERANFKTSSFQSTSTRCAPTHLLLFARDINEVEIVIGCELVAYYCDGSGRVASWAQRYACCALNFSLAAQKLRLQIVNDMATLHHIENL